MDGYTEEDGCGSLAILGFRRSLWSSFVCGWVQGWSALKLTWTGYSPLLALIWRGCNVSSFQKDRVFYKDGAYVPGEKCQRPEVGRRQTLRGFQTTTTHFCRDLFFLFCVYLFLLADLVVFWLMLVVNTLFSCWFFIGSVLMGNEIVVVPFFDLSFLLDFGLHR